MPADKAPGPDGFTGRFYQYAWPIIKLDVLAAISHVFNRGDRGLHRLNDALILLLPKKADSVEVTSFRPISLVHSFGKLITKILAARLAPELPKLIAPNQSAFIRRRSIHDNFRMVQLATKALHARRVPTVLLKIDIAKAFDSVSWPFLLCILRHMGFGERWIAIVCAILRSSSSRVFLNGVPGPRFWHRRGVRQGDPLAPMFFVAVMEALNAFFRRAEEDGMLAPLPCSGIKHRVSLYADDVAIFLSPARLDLETTRALLRCFGGATGFRTNVDKCIAMPIRCQQLHIDEVTDVFPCQVMHFPCPYLGLPLSYKRPSRAALQPVLDKIINRCPT